jgi:PD-(D/E)XK nuclease superfamily protein
MTDKLELYALSGLDTATAPEVERGTGRPDGYYLASKTRVPSATTITGRFKESSGLMRWAFQRGKDGHAELYDDVALTVGSLIHSVIESEINDVPTPVIPKEHQPSVSSAVSAWHEWFLTNSLVITATEIPLVSERHRFGGTLDTIVRDRQGRLAMGDWKSSKAVYSDYLLQLAAYKILWDENRDEPITGGFHLVRFSKEHGDMEHRYYPNLDDAEELFLLLRKAYDLDKSLSKRAR